MPDDVHGRSPQGTWTGASVPRPEARDKVTGDLKYIDDVPFEGLWGVTLRTTVARGTITNVRFLDGGPDWREFVIVSANDIPRLGADGHDRNLVDLIERDQPYLVRDEVRHVHEPIMLIGHRDLETAREALKFIEVKYAPKPPVLDYRQDPAPDQIQHGDDNVFHRILVSKGAADADDDGRAFEDVFDNAAKIIEGQYGTSAQEQCYIEPQCMIARIDVDDPNEHAGPVWPRNGFKVTIEGSMQCPYYVHKAMKTLFQLPDKKVRIIASPLGGGFGGKEDYPSIIAGHAALLALKSRMPVKILYDRVEDMCATTKRHPSQSWIRTAHDEAGRLLGVDMSVRLDGGAYLTLSPVVLSRGAIHAGGPYRVPHVRINNEVVLSNTPPNGAFRGFGAPQTIFAFERHLDICADTFAMDPADMRRINLIKQGDEIAVSQTIHEPIKLETWMEAALDATNYHQKRKEYDEFNAEQVANNGPWRRGVGLATFMHGAGFTGSGEDYLASIVDVRATPEGQVEVLTANTEMGQGSITVFTQIAADATGLDLEDIWIAANDTEHVPNSGPTVASRTSMVVGHLVARACDNLVEGLQSARLLGDSDIRDDGVPTPISALSEGVGQRYKAESLRRALRMAAERGGDVAKGTAQYQRPPGPTWDDKAYKGVAYGTYAWATYVADVEVDMRSFEVIVLDFVASQEIGKVLNPVLARGQIEGGAVQGIGWALLEDTVLDENGGMANHNMTTYVVPTFADVPRINVLFQEQPYDYGPMGAKGIGELPMDGPAPAVVNAVSHAVGVQVNDLPCSPERLMDAYLAGVAAQRSEEDAQ